MRESDSLVIEAFVPCKKYFKECIFSAVAFSKATEQWRKNALKVSVQLITNDTLKNFGEGWQMVNRPKIPHVGGIALFVDWFDISLFKAIWENIIF